MFKKVLVTATFMKERVFQWIKPVMFKNNNGTATLKKQQILTDWNTFVKKFFYYFRATNEQDDAQMKVFTIK